MFTFSKNRNCTLFIYIWAILNISKLLLHFLKNTLIHIKLSHIEQIIIKSHFLRNTGKAWKWCLQTFFAFSYFVLNDDIWHLVNFFPKNSNLFPRYWGPNFGPFRAKSDSLNEIATLKANICVKNIVEAFLFSFSESMGWIIQERANFDLLMLVVV